MLASRYSEIPNRLAYALDAWPLERSRVLDVGCSVGHCLVHFGPGSMGIDNDPHQVAFCRDIGLDVVQADVDRGLDQVPDGHFDYIWVSDIVEHLDAPRLLLRRLRPKLRDNGRLLLYITTRPVNRLSREAFYHRRINSFRAATHYYQFTRDTAAFLLRRAGYRVEGVHVPAARGRLGSLSSLLSAQAPTLIFSAIPDAELGRFVAGAEEKNKPAATLDS